MKHTSTLVTAVPSTPFGFRRGTLGRLTDYWAFSKPRVTLLVWVSMLFGMALAASGTVNAVPVLSAVVGTWLIIASANGFNQALEATQDAQMRRTATRPIPAGRFSRLEGAVVAGTWAVMALAVLYFGANPLTALLGAIAHGLYVAVYTPLKRVTPLCILAGAAAGAMPPVMGWTALRGAIEPTAIGLFAIQFLWQFPHTWAIAWLNREDYARVGFRMLPIAIPNGRVVGAYMLVTSALLLATSLFPLLSRTNVVYLAAAAALGWWLFNKALRYRRDPSRDTARQVLLSSVLYLPAILALLILCR